MIKRVPFLFLLHFPLLYPFPYPSLAPARGARGERERREGGREGRADHRWEGERGEEGGAAALKTA